MCLDGGTVAQMARRSATRLRWRRRISMCCSPTCFTGQTRRSTSPPPRQQFHGCMRLTRRRAARARSFQCARRLRVVCEDEALVFVPAGADKAEPIDDLGNTGVRMACMRAWWCRSVRVHGPHRSAARAGWHTQGDVFSTMFPAVAGDERSRAAAAVCARCHARARTLERNTACAPRACTG